MAWAEFWQYEHERDSRCADVLLVVIAIIAILIALLLPAVQKVREAANKGKRHPATY